MVTTSIVVALFAILAVLLVMVLAASSWQFHCYCTKTRPLIIMLIRHKPLRHKDIYWALCQKGWIGDQRTLAEILSALVYQGLLKHYRPKIGNNDQDYAGNVQYQLTDRGAKELRYAADNQYDS